MLMKPQLSYEHGFLGFSQGTLIVVIDRFITFSGACGFQDFKLVYLRHFRLYPPLLKCEV